MHEQLPISLTRTTQNNTHQHACQARSSLDRTMHRLLSLRFDPPTLSTRASCSEGPTICARDVPPPLLRCFYQAHLTLGVVHRRRVSAGLRLRYLPLSHHCNGTTDRLIPHPSGQLSESYNASAADAVAL